MISGIIQQNLRFPLGAHCPALKEVERNCYWHGKCSNVVFCKKSRPEVIFRAERNILYHPIKHLARRKFLHHFFKIPADKKIVAVMSAEIGGMNSIEPLILGAKLELPVVDCDGMGRAFPELDMFVPHIHGLPACPSVIVGSSTSYYAMTYAPTAKDLENDLRELIVSKMG